LREEECDLGEQRTPERAHPQIAGKGAVGDAGVDDRDGNRGALAFKQQPRPEFAFHEDQHLGPDCAQIGADGEGEVQREVEDEFCAKAFAGDLLACGGGGGDDDGTAGETFAQFSHEALGREDLADGDGVQPDGLAALDRLAERGWDESEALGEAFAITIAGGHAPEPPRRGEGQGEGQEQTVEEDEQARRAPISACPAWRWRG
jgi:hypothetical protein